MTIQFNATYRAGAIHPDQPLALPENTKVNVVVVPVGDATKRAVAEDIEAIRPKAPRFTADELDALIAKCSVSVGSLPVDFSREDIYQDHD
ncbi:MAG: antitoxin AF2212-like protein [Pirellulales bacterium]